MPLSRDNDPFFTGRDAHWRDARWFAEAWRAAGYSDIRAHLRKFHYRLFATQAETARGTRYENLTRCWEALTAASKWARYLDLVPVDAISDARNAPPQVNAPPPFHGEPVAQYAADPHRDWLNRPDWQLPRIHTGTLDEPGRFIMPAFTVSGYRYEIGDEPVLLSVWCEKSTMDDILAPLCAGLGVNYLAGTGFESIPAVVALLRRGQAHPARRVHVFYISDYDPAGQQMPVSVARQAQFWAAKLGIEARLTIQPLALTSGQITQYGLPEDFSKPGRGRVELDALEAFVPGELERLTRHAVQPWRDGSLRARLAAAETEAQRVLDDVWESEFRISRSG